MKYGDFVLPDSSYVVGNHCFMKFRNSAEVMKTVAIWQDMGAEPRVDRQMLLVVISTAYADLTLITPKRS